MDRAEYNAYQTCVIGYGNPSRRDDGIGAFVTDKLRGSLGNGTSILAFHQLDPAVLEEIRESDLVVFVDATAERLAGGMKWKRLRPEGSGFGHTTHHFEPSLLLGLLSSLYGRVPETWLISIQGDDFGHGDKLTNEAQARALKACREITGFISAKTG